MRVMICGAGIAGLTLALGLERESHEVVIVERAPSLREEGYMIDFFGSGYDAMERLGLLPQLAAIHEPVERMIILDADGCERVSVPYAALRQRLFRDRHFNFMRGRLNRLLYRQLSASTIRFGTTVDSYHDDGRRIDVRLSDGTRQVVDLLVGADGVHSAFGRIVFATTDAVRLLGYEAAAFTVERPPPSLAIGRDLITITAPHRQVTIYRTSTGNLATFFFTKRGVPFDIELAARLRILQGNVSRFSFDCSGRAEALRGSSRLVLRQSHADRHASLESRASRSVETHANASHRSRPGASMAVAGAYLLAHHLKNDRDLATARGIEQALKPAIVKQQAAATRIARWLFRRVRSASGCATW